MQFNITKLYYRWSHEIQNRKQQNKLSIYPLISVSNSILVNFMYLATDIGSFIDAGRLFHNTDPLNFNKRLPKEEFTETKREDGFMVQPNVRIKDGQRTNQERTCMTWCCIGLEFSTYKYISKALNHKTPWQKQWKSARRRRKRCALAVVRRSQNFSPRRRPPYWGRGTAKI